MTDIDKLKVADLEPMPRPGCEAVYGLGIMPLLRIGLNINGMLEFFSNDRSVSHVVLDAGLDGPLAPS